MNDQQSTKHSLRVKEGKERTRWLSGGVPRRVRNQDRPRVEILDGTLLMIDVVGFTRLSERLAKHGSAGTELMISTITAALSALTSAVEARGGDVLLIAGDALLVLFDGPNHRDRAQSAAEDARRALRSVSRVDTPAGAVVLKVSQGLASGSIGMIDTGSDFTALVPWGPTVVAVLSAQKAAQAGEINRDESAEGTDLAVRPKKSRRTSEVQQLSVISTDPATYISPTITDQLPDIAYDHEHRAVSTAFVHWSSLGTDVHTAAANAEELVDRVAELCAINEVTLTCAEPTGFGLRFMLTAGAPLTNEHDADAILRTVFQLLDVDANNPPTVGVTRGLAFAGVMGTVNRWTWSAMGDCVNVAARLSSKASPGQVLVDDGVINALRSHVNVVPLDSANVHSRRGAVKPYWVQTAPVEGTPSTAVDFCGRQGDVHELTRWLDNSDSPVQVMAIRGVPGIGSTALAEHVIGDRDRIELRGRSDQQLVPFGSLQRELRRLLHLSADAPIHEVTRKLESWIINHDPHLVDDVPLLLSALGTDSGFRASGQEAGRALRLVSAVTRLIGSVLGATGLLFVDRPHLLDATSQLVLRDFAVTNRRPGLRILITSRTGEDIPIDVDRTLELTTLDPGDAAKIARQILEQRNQPTTVAATIAEQAQGIPRQIIAMAQTWSPHSADLPTEFESLLAMQIDALPAQLRRLVRYLSALGDVMPTSTIRRALADPDDERLLELAALFEQGNVLSQLSGLVEPTGGDQIRFVDPLVRHVAYQGLSFKRRRQLHGRIGLILEQADAHPAIVANHFLRAGNYPKAWRWANRAGDSAHAAGAFNESADAYSMAIQASAGADVDPDLIARTAERWGDSARMAARYEEASRAYKQAQVGAATGAQPRLLTKRAWVEGDQGHYAHAIRLTSQAIAAADLLPRKMRDRVQAAAYVRRAGIRIRQGRFSDAETAIRHALQHATKNGDEWSARAYLLLDSVLVDTGRSELAQEPRAKALSTYRALGDWEGVGQALNNYGIEAYWNGDLNAAERWYRESLDAFTKAGDAIGIAMADNNLGEVASDLGQLDEAEQHFGSFLITSARAGNEQFVAHAYTNLAVIRMRRGRAREAVQLLDQAVTRFESLGSQHFADQARVHRIEALIDAGEADQARQQLMELNIDRDQRTGLATMTSTIEALTERLSAN